MSLWNSLFDYLFWDFGFSLTLQFPISYGFSKDKNHLKMCPCLSSTGWVICLRSWHFYILVIVSWWRLLPTEHGCSKLFGGLLSVWLSELLLELLSDVCSWQPQQFNSILDCNTHAHAHAQLIWCCLWTLIHHAVSRYPLSVDWYLLWELWDWIGMFDCQALYLQPVLTAKTSCWCWHALDSILSGHFPGDLGAWFTARYSAWLSVH